MTWPTAEDALEARAALAPLVVRTPVLRAEALDDLVGRPVYAKMESLQYTGSFKVRGATNRLRTLSRATLDGGLITVSAGNAALGAAHAARRFAARLTVVMPANAVAEKLAAVRAYGGTVVSEGITSAAVAFDRAAELSKRDGLTFVHPYDDPMVIAGAATATMELLEEVPDLAALYVPCSGGGLLAGAVLAARALGSQVQIVGVQPSGAAGFVASLTADRPVAPSVIATIADGLTAPKPGRIPFEMVRDSATTVTTVGDEHILNAMAVLVRALRVVIEPSAAVGLAAVLSETPQSEVGSVGLLVSGSNVSASLLASCVVRATS